MKPVKSFLTVVLGCLLLAGCITVPAASTQTQQKPVQQPAQTQQQPTQTQQQQPAQTQQPVQNQQQPGQNQQQPGQTQQRSMQTQQQPVPTQQQPAPAQQQTSSQTTSSTTVAPTAKVRSTSGLTITTDNSYLTGTILVKLTNDSSKDIEDIELELTLIADDSIPTVSSATLTGGSTVWTYSGKSGKKLKFINSSDISVDADSTDSMTLTVQVYFSTTVTEDIGFDAEVEITDYNS
jgi:hypothetical protein